MTTLLRRLSVRMADHAARALPASRSEWARAMQNEVAHIDDDIEAVRWAIGCVLAGYAERISATDPVEGVTNMKHHQISLGLIVGAVVCLLAGSGEGASALVLICLALETTFWVRVRGRPSPTTLQDAALNVTLDAAFACYAYLILALALQGIWMWWAGNAFLQDAEVVARHDAHLGLAVALNHSGGETVAFVAALAVLMLPFRQGAPWARWAIPALLLLQFAVLWPSRNYYVPHSGYDGTARVVFCVVLTMAALALSLITPQRSAVARA